ncbi:MAG: hypothetical protein AB1635_15720 [Acidobacteriota bacterium]
MQENVAVAVGQAVTLQPVLRVAAVAETVTVSAAPTVVDGDGLDAQRTDHRHHALPGPLV